MAIPDYQSLMAPALRALADGEPRSAAQIREVVAAALGITKDDRLEVVKSGVSVFDSRIGWALTYMSQAGLVVRPKLSGA